MQRHFKKSLTLLLLVISASVFAQSTQRSTGIDGFSIQGKIKGLKDTVSILAHYLGFNQQVVKDTAKIDGEGNLHFKGTKFLPEGLYLISLPKGRYIDFVIGNQNFSFETDTANYVKHMKIKGSKENEIFYTFQQDMNKRFDELRALNAEKKAKGGKEVEAKIKKLQEELALFQKDWLVKNHDTFAAKLIKASQDPEIPPYGKPLLTKADSSAFYNYQFGYYKSHFWDNIDLNDERMMKTPFLQKKIERYFEDLTVQTSDSIAMEADKLLAKTKARDIRRYIVYKLASSYETPKIVGTDGAFVHMAEKYYIGEPEMWDTSTVRRMKERVKVLKPLLVGKRLPEIYCTDTLGRELPLSSVIADYTVVFFYDPECGHCREAAPKLVKMLPELKKRGVRIYAASMDRDITKWKKFINEFKTQEFVNVIDVHKNPQTGKEEYYTDFRNVYDVVTTPMVYVLDRNKKILGSHIPVDQIEGLIDFYKSQEVRAKSANPKSGK